MLLYNDKTLNLEVKNDKTVQTWKQFKLYIPFMQRKKYIC